jgi:hypothetical protein
VQIKHADNVAKGFALSASVVLTVIVCILFFHYQLTVSVIFGTLTVLLATFAFENGVKGWFDWMPSFKRQADVPAEDVESSAALLEKSKSAA